MPKAVFTTKPTPSYDDLPEERYHFPQTYLRQVKAAEGDWIVYYEPRRTSADLASRGGRQAYFATARVRAVEPDPAGNDHFYALMSDFLEFDRPVPFREGAHYYEGQLMRGDGQTNRGAFGRAVRELPSHEFDAILAAGFATVLDDIGSRGQPDSPDGRAYMTEDAATPIARKIVERMVARPFRDAAFAAAVKTAYNKTCAITGLRIINGGGRSEVQAAHIRPVELGGSDSVRNGLALSSTVHWMFDRGLISVDDDLTILVAKDRLPEQAMRLIREERRLIRPDREDALPHPALLKFHRETIFKG